jgi:hypothetical protein
MGFTHFEVRMSRLLLSGILLCQMCCLPIDALGAESGALNDATNDTAGYRTVRPDRTIPRLSENPALLALSDFSACDPNFSSIKDHAHNYLQPDPANSHRCVAGIGANHVTYGRLITPEFPVSRDVWMSGYVYFPVGFQLPAVSSDAGAVCNGGVHVWRLHEGLTANSNRISMDFNVPAGMDVVQFYVFRDNGGQGFVKNTKFKPAKLKGQWQYWQVHVNLGTPGKDDGFLRFYANGKLVDSMEHQPFLPSGADASWGFSFADLQSNIGGCSAHWPVQNGWLVSNVRVCKNDVC